MNDYDQFDDEYEDIDLKWTDFWSKGATDYENHEVCTRYHPAFVCSPSSRKPGYYLPHPVGVKECTPA